MALQFTGGAKPDSIANMQLRLPVVIIGGGLTAIDTATESLAYYPVQVEKFLRRYEALAAENGEDSVRDVWSDEEREIAEEFLAHARAIRSERAHSVREGRPLRVIQLLQEWGGATVAYRRRLIDSPSYTLNHEEVQKAFEEGITFAECVAPLSVDIDDYGAARGINFHRQRLEENGRWSVSGECHLPARTILVAAGTHPNTVLAREDAAHFVLDGKYFRACNEDGEPVNVEHAISKPKETHVLLAKRRDGRFISFFGDVHPSFFGNVVKAMGGAKQGYPAVSCVLDKIKPATSVGDKEFIA